MQNPHKGEVSFEVGGKRRRLVYTNNALCALEDHLGRGILDIYAELACLVPKTDTKGKILPETQAEAAARARRIRLGFCRAVLWAGCLEDDKEMTIEQAGDLITEIGGITSTISLIMGGVAAAQPKAAESQDTRPPKEVSRRRGTGSTS